jgi:hypothetical protein
MTARGRGAQGEAISEQKSIRVLKLDGLFREGVRS